MRKKILLALFAACFLTGPERVCALPAAPGPQEEGIDVSQWQGSIDFQQVADAGIRAVYIRSSLGGGYVDPYFEQNYQGAKAAGLKVGFYHYVTASTASQARYQAQFFVNTVQGKEYDCRLAMDFESLAGLTEAEAEQIGLAFIQEVQQASAEEPVIYSDTSNAQTMFGGALTEYPLWAAEYGVSSPSSAVNWDCWAGWQYTDEGQVSGISGDVDRDLYTDAMFLDEPEQAKPAKAPNPSAETITYQVQNGDTLWSIAQRYHTTAAAIARENDLSNPNIIHTGQTLKITVADDAPQADGYTIYTVQNGDTLSGIAAKFQTTAAQLAALNGIANPNVIHTGQRLRIPV